MDFWLNIYSVFISLFTKTTFCSAVVDSLVLVFFPRELVLVRVFEL